MQQYSAFGLNFHSKKILFEFVSIAILIFALPVGGYFSMNYYLENHTKTTESKRAQYSGIFAVVLVNLILIGYGIRVATDPTNFNHEKQTALLNQAKTQEKNPVISDSKAQNIETKPTKNEKNTQVTQRKDNKQAQKNKGSPVKDEKEKVPKAQKKGKKK